MVEEDALAALLKLHPQSHLALIESCGLTIEVIGRKTDMLGHQDRCAPANVSADSGAGSGQGGIHHAVTHLLAGKIDALPRRLLGEGAIHRQR
ncbi:hypothetical protein D3C72_1737670 [compost metagenome]